MGYRWNEAKRTANLAKHGVDFADAVGALEDPAALTLEDGDSQGESIRIISARRASPAEARPYREG